MRTSAFAGLLTFAIVACGAPEVQAPVAGAPARDDSIEARFKRAYFAVACLANAGKDPEMTITPLRKPLDYLDGAGAASQGRAGKAMEALAASGFPTVEAFRDVERRLRERTAWWSSQIDARFVDELKACR
jgi:hypothetical protein